jgi:ABC-type multidrug transport system fused ATPase/permease subunit
MSGEATAHGANGAVSATSNAQEDAAAVQQDVAPIGDHDKHSDEKGMFRKFGHRVAAARRGSTLRQNDERASHLGRLLLKRSIREDMMASLSAHQPVSEITTGVQSSTIMHGSYKDGKVEMGSNAYLDELRAEVEQEMNQGTDSESAKIREIAEIGKQYQEQLSHFNEFPLEVRLRNVSYKVTLDASDQHIQTVYNTSFLYPIVQTSQRILKGEPRATQPATRQKDILSNISLVLHPGKQYLVLGSPGCGKTTFLRAISGQLQPSKDASLGGEISYNGRTLEVRTNSVTATRLSTA